ncbi:MAG: HAD-IA family hydrolase [Armatimonadota bacterium]|nr:HAD-IA family hydrolase [Armatimonadota bacterium]
MIKVLVSDLGKVVLPFDFAPSKEFLRQRSRSVSAGGSSPDPWSVLSQLHERLAFGAGGCERAEFFRQLVAELQLDATYDEFRTAFCDIFEEDHAVVELIRRARVEHRFLLSNTNAIHWEWILAHHSEILKVFDQLLASQELRAIKPHPEIYQKVEALTGLPPATHLLIDDLAENIEGARACGWDGIIFTTAASLALELEERQLL